MRSKKAQLLLGAGALAVLGAFVLLIIIASLIFLSVNKFSVIGGGLIALTLIFGLKGQFNKTKAITIGVLVVVGVLFVAIAPAMNSQLQGTTYTYYDENVGYIDTTINDKTVLTSLFQRNVEQSYFAATKSDVGGSINTYDTFKFFDLLLGNKIIFRVYRDGQQYTTYRTGIPDLSDGRDKYVHVNFYAGQPGTYTVTGEVWKDSTKIRDYIIGNTLIVTEKSVCEKSSYSTSWKLANTISNGIQEKKTYYSVDDNCYYYTKSTSKRTTCDSGYVVTGTTSQTSDGYNLCELAEQEPEPVECNSDKTLQCDDGSSILLKLCVNNKWKDTNNQCPIDDPVIDDPVIDDPVIDDPKDCETEDCLDVLPDDTSNEINQELMKYIAFGIAGLGGFVFLLLLVAVIIKSRRKRR